MRTLLAVMIVLANAAAAQAGPPSYLLLRQPESPRPSHRPGDPAAAYFDVRTDGYAYGYFGVRPRSHWSRSFGVHRMYHQWSRW
jgi:hypothetical protein